MICSISIGGIVGISIAALFVLCFLILAIRANTRSVKQSEVEMVTDDDIDAEGAAKRLMEAIRFPTMSMVEGYKDNSQPFLDLRKWMLENYPSLAKTAELTIIADYSLVFCIKGSDPSLKPGCLLSHQDVVPADPRGWSYPPFDAVLADDGYIYGRGALDMKNHLIAVLESVEYWLKKGKKFKRTLYLCFGHDEEPGRNDNGASKIVKYFKEKGITFEFVVDEGGSMIEGKQLFAKGYVAAVGATEKGQGNLEITVTKAGGHASRPAYPSANGILASVIKKIESRQMPTRMTPLLKSTFTMLASSTNPVFKFFLCNTDVFSPLLRFILSKANPVTNALVRTTMATTMIWGSDARNTIPGEVKLNVNFRLLSGDTADDVVAHLNKILRKWIKKGEIKISVLHSAPASPESPCDTEAFATISKCIRETFPDTTVIPYIFLGGTDSHHYAPVCDNIYRFGPVLIGLEDEHRFHGIDERISPESLAKMVQFFVTYVKESCGVE